MTTSGVPSASQASISANDERRLFEMYDRYRTYMVHEDDLIHQRTTWMITMQSFIVATFGFGVQKKFEVVKDLNVKFEQTQVSTTQIMPEFQRVSGQLDSLLFGLCFLGGIIAYFTLRSVEAAVSALEQLKDDWTKSLLKYDQSGRDATKLLPGIAGGGSPLAASEGFALPTWLPYVFIWTWVAAFLVLIGIRVGFVVL